MFIYAVVFVVVVVVCLFLLQLSPRAVNAVDECTAQIYFLVMASCNLHM